MKLSYGSYKNWSRISERLEISDLMLMVWDLLCDTHSEREDCFYALLKVFYIMDSAQMKMFEDVVKADRDEIFKELLSIMGKVILKAKLNLDSFSELNTQLAEEEFQRYLYKSIHYILIHVMGESIQVFHADNLVQEPEEHTDIEDTTPFAERHEITIRELDVDVDISRQAKDLYYFIAENWPPKLINVLCHYYEKANGIDTLRLSAESRNNIYKLHERLRYKIFSTVDSGAFPKHVWKAFFKQYMPQICQETPISTTYKIVKTEISS